MNLKSFSLLFFLLPLASLAQFNPVKQAQTKLAKGKWHEGQTLLNKAIRKDSLQVQAHFVYSQLYLNPKFPNHHIDSAYRFAEKAKKLYSLLNSREREKLKKFPLDSSLLTKHFNSIDSLAFNSAKNEGTESAYIHFLNLYSASKQRTLAIELRDEAAFLDALKQNTHSAFRVFLEKYPIGHRSIEANQRYEKLHFEFSTRNNSLQQFKQYAADYPASRHTPDAIGKIFEIETLGGEVEVFENFIRQYPHSIQAKQAALLLIHLQRELPSKSSFKFEWLPIYDEQGWGFITLEGTIMLSGLGTLHEVNFCQSLQTDFILTMEGIISRNGQVIHSGNFESVRDIGAGFLLLKAIEGNELLHKTIWPVHLRNLDDAQVILNRFLAIKREDLWALYSLSGKPLTEFVFQSIESTSNFTLFKRSGKMLLVPNNQILQFLQARYQPTVADEIKPMGNRFWLRNGALEQVIDDQFNVIIPLGRHSISFGALGLMVKQGNQTKLHDWTPFMNSPAQSITIAEPWAIIQGVGQKPELHHIPTMKAIETLADSIWFNQSFAILKRNDSIHLYLSYQQTIVIPSDENISLQKSKDSTLFIFTNHRNKTRVIDAATLKEIFSSEYKLEPILQNVFLYESKGKKGLLDRKGKIIIPAIYDAIVFNQGIFSLLQNNLFGMFHLASKKMIKPSFESNLRAIGSNTFTAKKKSKWILLSSIGKELSKLSFEDIQPWSDSIALVTLAGKQALFNIPLQKILVDSLDDIRKVLPETQNQTFIIDSPKGYGLINNSGKIIIEPTLEELVSYETLESPLLLGISVIDPQHRLVQYLSSSGKIIYSFTAPKELAYKLLCDW